MFSLVIVLFSQSLLVEHSGAEDETNSTKAIAVVESQSIVFEDSHTDPYDRANYFGFNHAQASPY